MELSTLPLDLLAEILQYLDSSDVALLLSTFSRCLHFGLTKLGLPRVFHVPAGKSVNKCHLLYLLSLSSEVDEVVFDRQSDTPLALIRELSSRSTVQSLIISGIIGDVKRLPFFEAGARDSEKLAEEALLPLSCSRSGRFFLPLLSELFPTLSTLIVSQKLSSLFREVEPRPQRWSVDTDSNVNLVLHFASLLPPNLTTLHYVDHMKYSLSITSFMMLLPHSLTELVLDFEAPIGGKLLESCMRFPSLVRLCLFCTSSWVSSILPEEPSYRGESLVHLKELEIATLHKCQQDLALRGHLFSFLRMPNLERLSFTFGTALLRGYAGVADVDLSHTLPPKITDLNLFRVPPTGISGFSLHIPALPNTLTSLTVSSGGSNWGNSHFIALLRSLVLLNTFVEISSLGRSLRPIDWQTFPPSLTHLEMSEFGLTREGMANDQALGDVAMEEIPKRLVHLRCRVHSLKAAHWFTSKRPQCLLIIEHEMELHAEDTLFVMEMRDVLENRTLPGSVCDSDILHTIRTLLGPQCQSSWAFQQLEPRAKYADKQRLDFGKGLESLTISSASGCDGLVSFDSRQFSISYVSEIHSLTSLDVDVRSELMASDFPPNLTYLHLRNTPLHKGIISKLFTLEPLHSVHAHGRLTHNETPRTAKKWRVFDIPDLSVHFRRLPSLCCDDLEELCCKTYGAMDHELKSFVLSWARAKRIQLSASIVLTGGLIDPTLETISYATLVDSMNALSSIPGIVVSDYVVRSICVPDGPLILDLECVNDSNMKGDLIASLPRTLTSLSIRNTSFSVEWKTLVPLLPPTLTSFCMQPLHGSHIHLDTFANLPHLQVLKLVWPEERDAEVLRFSISMLTNLLELELSCIKIEGESIQKATEHLTLLESLKLFELEDVEARDVCATLSNLKSINIDTLVVTGRIASDEESNVDWEKFLLSSLKNLPKCLRYKQVTLPKRIAMTSTGLQSLSLRHDCLGFLETSSSTVQGEDRVLFESIAKQMQCWNFFALPDPLPASLMRLTFFTTSTVPAPWVHMLAILSTAPNLEYVHLEMEMDFSADPPLDKPSALTALKSLHIPKATTSKRDGAVLHLPPTITELVAPELRLNPRGGDYPEEFTILDIWNVSVVKRQLLYNASSAKSKKK